MSTCRHSFSARATVVLTLSASMIWSLGCSRGRVRGPTQTACSVAIPDGTCPDGQTCVDGLCQPDVVSPACSVDNPSGTCAGGQACVNGACVVEAAPTCVDQAHNGDETDTDCGGTDCLACGDNLACLLDLDCTSGACIANLCTPAACDDTRQNGLESATDCGGPACPPCSSGGCTLPSDCQSGVCTSLTHQCQAPSCTDQVKNGNETGVDCGGSCTDLGLRCAAGTACVTANDCASAVCGAGQCRISSCGNDTRDNDETGVDCGGPACAPCATGVYCVLGADCQSGVCHNDECLAATCDDTVKNQAEIDVDCGGPCPACGLGASCVADGDCQSGVCRASLCRVVTCINATQDNGETGVDCGGPCAACGSGGGCSAPGDCESGVCQTGACAAPICSDGVKNGDETGIDCGAVACANACTVGQGCTTDWDCDSQSCHPDTRVCVSPTCTDQRQNAVETGVDCGGATCGACPAGLGCGADNDCQSLVCTNEACVAAACNDTVENGDETGVDCGGSCVNASPPLPCAVGSGCESAADCSTNLCVGGYCAADHCTNGVQDEGETGLNCGGGQCAPCAEDGGCANNSDCESGVCTALTCAAPSCGDTVKNGDETDLNCGGTCPGCADGLACDTSADCANQACVLNRCQPARCDDHVQNGDETDADCGGGCTPCADSASCLAPADCQSGVCTGHVCQRPSCDPMDSIKNGNETDVDCGGVDCPSCGTASACLRATDCQSLVCTNGSCRAPSCVPADLTKNGSETDVDCGGDGCPTCAQGLHCLVAADCSTGACNASFVCAPVGCNDDVENGEETDVDCGGPDCGRCAAGFSCDVAGDCTSLVCTNGLGGTDNTTCTSGGLCCQATSCTDNTKNGDEGDVDCGGTGGCARCTTNDTCNVSTDCESHVCIGEVCHAAACGDGVQNGTELCDDGNVSNCSGTCRSDCAALFTPSGCGDATICGVEACDNGASNGDTCAYGETSCTVCTTSCTVAAGVPSYCGDGATDSAREDCDDDNAATELCNYGLTSCTVCDSTCHEAAGATRYCGDTITQSNEICDDGNTVQCTGGCSADCQHAITGCGDSALCGAEVCETGNLNGQSCANWGGTGTLGCATDCLSFNLTSCVNVCGNNVVDGSLEVCDGAALGGNTCETFGGSLTDPLGCVTTCNAFDLSSCLNTCGNGLIDMGETCDGVQLAGMECSDWGGAGNLACLPDCSGYDLSPCTAVCGNGVVENTEQCDSLALGGNTCESNGFDGGVPRCASDCSFDGSLCYQCGDDVKGGPEVCDGSDLGTPAATCTTVGFSDGLLQCNASCNGFDTTQCTTCGDGTIATGELCDSQSLDGRDCQALSICLGGANNGLVCTGAGDCPSGTCTANYFGGGALACAGACDTYDTSNCLHCDVTTCTAAGGVCAEGVCDCGLYQTRCGDTCTSTKTDPNNCGDCGVICSDGQVCSAGVCSGGCPSPLVACGGRCIDPLINNTYCGASGACSGASDGDDCIVNYTPDRVCNNGVCIAVVADYTQAGDAATRCIGGGPTLDLNLGTSSEVVPGALSCTGDLAAVSFRYALCSCGTVDSASGHPFFADGFDSANGPYTPTCENGTTVCALPGSGTDSTCAGIDTNGDGLATCADDRGAGIGTNSTFTVGSPTTVWGTLWLSNGLATYPDETLVTTTVEQDLCVGSDVSGSPTHVRGDGYVAGSIANTGSFAGTLHQSQGMTSAMTAASIDRTANPLAVPQACDCDDSAGQLIDAAAIVTAHACTGGAPVGSACQGGDNNNNLDIGLSPTALDNKGTKRVDLPCGQYYLTNVIGAANDTISIVVHGRTAIYIGGEIDVPKDLTISLTDAAELDVFVTGTISNNGTTSGFTVGSPSYPSRVRIYSSGVGTAAIALKTFNGAANIYAPYGEIYMPQTFTLYGSFFAGSVRIVQRPTFHFDTGIVHAGDTCPSDCGNDALNSGEICDEALLGGRTCATLGYDGGTLLCAGDCSAYDTSHCYLCGDAVVNGAEQCEPTVAVTATCNSVGYDNTDLLTCRNDCRFNTSQCRRCGNSVVDPGEQCEPGLLGGATCQSLGFSAGNLRCNPSTCAYDTSPCSECGDSTVQWPEQCEPGLLGGHTCEGFGFVGGVLACSVTSCLFDTNACTTSGTCGNGTVEQGEQCDDNNAVDTDNCRNNCTRPVCGDGFVSTTASGGYTEQCDGANHNFQQCSTLGFQTGTLACAPTCTFDTSACVRCGDGKLSAGEQCEATLPLSQSCESLGYTGGTLACDADTCQLVVSGCNNCGSDGDQIEGDEECDGANLGGYDCLSINRGFTGGSLACNADCTYDTALCFTCGNGVINTGESCDPGAPPAIAAALGGYNCATYPGTSFVGGVLACTSTCAFDTTACSLCGNGVTNGTEQCDLAALSVPDCLSLGAGYTGGALACNADCTFDLGGCATSATCGDDTVVSPEQCEPNVALTSDCVTQGYLAGGTLACDVASCTFDTSNCCGDGVRGTLEACDGAALGGATCSSLGQGYVGGTLGCTPSCTLDTSGCWGCASCRDCNNQACNSTTHQCGACTSNSDCCAPLHCLFGTCGLF